MGDVRGLPARGYSWPPFEAGNTVALRHGAWSPRSVAPIADKLAAQLERVAPWATAAAFHGATASWAWAEAQAVLLRAYVDEHGHLDDDGHPRPAVGLLERVEAKLVKLRDALGLTPASLGRLMASAATVANSTGDQGALDALRAEGRRLLAATAEPGT